MRPAGWCPVGQISPSNSQSKLSFAVAITKHFVSSWSAARKHHFGVGGGDIDAQSSVRGAVPAQSQSCSGSSTRWSAGGAWAAARCRATTGLRTHRVARKTRPGASLYSAASHSHRFAGYLLLRGYDQQHGPIRLLYRRWARPVDDQRPRCCYWVSKRRPKFSSSVPTHYQHQPTDAWPLNLPSRPRISSAANRSRLTSTIHHQNWQLIHAYQAGTGSSGGCCCCCRRRCGSRSQSTSVTQSAAFTALTGV